MLRQMIMALVTMFYSCQVPPAQVPSCETLRQDNKIYVKEIICSNKDIVELEEYNESDDLLYRSRGMVVYLNQTSPKCDTIYVYQLH